MYCLTKWADILKIAVLLIVVFILLFFILFRFVYRENKKEHEKDKIWRVALTEERVIIWQPLSAKVQVCLKRMRIKKSLYFHM